MNSALMSRTLAFCVLTLFSALALPSTANAMDTGFNFRWGYDFSHDSKKLVQAAVIGYPNDHRAITAGEGEFITLGASLISDSRDFTLDAAAGVKSSTMCDYYNTHNSGGDYWWLDLLWPTCAWDATLKAEFSRIPFELIATYNGVPGLRLGAGLTYQTSPTIYVHAPLADYKISFDNALGYVAEIAHTVSSGDSSAYVGMRYTWLSYSIGGVEVAKANGAGLFVGLTFW